MRKPKNSSGDGTAVASAAGEAARGAGDGAGDAGLAASAGGLGAEAAADAKKSGRCRPTSRRATARRVDHSKAFRDGPDGNVGRRAIMDVCRERPDEPS
jgi:hypothetical protein